MKAALRFVFLFLVFLGGCAGMDPAKPQTSLEQFPIRNQDPRVGLVINTGTMPVNLEIYDQAGRLVEQTYLAGASRWVTVGGQPLTHYWIRGLDPGNYRIEAYYFFYTIRLIPPARYRVDLRRQTYSVSVGANPEAYHYGGRHWGWLLQLGTNIPEGADGLPFGIQLTLPQF